MRHIGHPDMTVVLYAKGSVHGLQMLSTLHNALQSTVSYALHSPLLKTMKFLLSGLLSQQVCWHGRGSKPMVSYNSNPKTRHLFRVTSWRARTEWCSASVWVSTMCCLFQPTGGPARPTHPFAMLESTARHVPSHTGCTALPKHKSVFPAIVQTKSPCGQLSHDYRNKCRTRFLVSAVPEFTRTVQLLP